MGYLEKASDPVKVTIIKFAHTIAWKLMFESTYKHTRSQSWIL